MRLRHLVEHIKGQNWTAVCLDFVIVVAGIVVGVQVNDWWGSRLDARKEREYLIALKEDVGQTIRELESDTAGYRSIAASMVALLEASRHEDAHPSVEELTRNCSRLLYMQSTSIVADTYSNLTGSGDLSLIRSQELRNALASFYARADIVRVVSQTHELQLVNIFQPYIVRNLDYVAVFNRERTLPGANVESLPPAFDEGRILHVLATAEFRNVVAVKYDISTDLLNVLVITLKQARMVDALLARELAARGA